MNGPVINGPNGPIAAGPPPPNLPPSPPHSNARSSNGSRMYSMSSNPGNTRKYSMQVMESELQEHHRVLRAFLDQSLKDDRGYHPHNRARDKLLRLSAIQFQELSTDVYDELLRREDERSAMAAGNSNKVPRSLPAKPNFHPKRNQARQKLSTLASRKFRELATDVLYELERRVPRIAASTSDRTGATSPTGSNASFNQRGLPNGRGGRASNGLSVSIPPPPPYQSRKSVTSPQTPYSPGLLDGDATPANDYGRPMAKQLQSSTMVPTKSTMVEDDDDASDGASAYDVDSRHMSRASKRTTAMSGVGRLRDSHFAAEQNTQILQLQQKLSELEEQLKQKEVELSAAQAKAEEDTKAEQAKSSSILTDLERQVQSAEELNANMKQELERLREANAGLEANLQEQAAVNGDAEDLKSRNLELEDTAKDHEALREEYDALQTNHQRAQEEHGLLLDDHRQVKNQLGSLEGRHTALQEQHERLLGDHDNLTNNHADLGNNLERVLSEHSQLKLQQQNNEEAAAWQSKHQDLQQRYNDREEAVQQVKQESAHTMQELQILSQQHDQSEEEREKLHATISQLQEEVVQWKNRYAKSKTLRTNKANSMVLSADQPDAAQTAQDASLRSPTGIVKDIHVTNYQTAINEILRLARSDDYSAAYNHMRPVVSAVTAMAKDLDAAAPSQSEETVKEYTKLKRHISKATNSLVTASKVFAASNGVSPLLHVDTSAMDLTTAVIALIKVVKILPTPTQELQDSDDEPA